MTSPIEELSVWGDEHGVTWATADDETKESFALVRLFWYYRMIANGGPDSSDLDREITDLDREIMDQAREASDWFWPILLERAEAAGL